jgi:phosphoglycolate phosphatase
MRSIIFDMDGTLINSSVVIANTINYVRESMGLPPMDRELLLQGVNDPEINGSKFFYGTDSYTEKQTELFESYYDKHCIIDIELYSGVYQLLQKLKEQGIELFIATNASSYFAEKMLKQVKIDSFFRGVVGPNLVKRPKPYPDMVLKLISDWNLDRSETVLVGDSQKDTLSAQQAGVRGVLVNWGFSEYNDGAINSIEELENLLLS